MLYYLLLPLVAILIIALQTTIADIIFSGRVVLEISLIFVVYAGFRLSLVKGTVSCFVLGFVYDCIAGSVLGLFTLIYSLVFLASFFVSLHLIAEKMYLIALFAFICACLEEFLVIIFYSLAYGYDIGQGNPLIFLPRTLIVGVLTPILFHAVRKIEVLLYGKAAQSAERSGAGRVPSEI